jgi:ATP-binding cassette, subfamily B, bacterial
VSAASAAVTNPAPPRDALREAWRGFRVLMSFSFTAAPREATLFLLCACVMALGGPAGALGAKLLVDSVQQTDLPAALRAGVLLSLVAGVMLVNTLYYLDFLFAVAEKAGLEANRRLMRLIGGVPGLAHHELPEYLKELDTLRDQRGGLA